MTPAFLARHRRLGRRLAIVAMGLWIVAQVLIPLRHHLYPGDTSWTEQGHRFAWQMKLRDKQSHTVFVVRDPATGRSWKVETLRFLTPRQAVKMSSRPDMILQFAHHIAETLRARGIADPEVRVLAMSSLNGREPEFLIEPDRDLAKIERNLLPADWITPEPGPSPAR